MPKPDQTAAESAPKESPPESPQPATAESTVNSADAAEPGPDAPTASDETAADSPPSADELRAQLDAAQAENAQMKDGLLRAKAEVENIRRRSQNEIVAARKFAIEGFARELLEVKDSLDRAAAVELNEGTGEAVRQMKEGLGLTLKQLDLAMSRFAVVEVEAAPGVRFDPECHQAVSMAAGGEVEADHIVSVVQKGFLLKERLLRPAMVVVAKS